MARIPIENGGWFDDEAAHIFRGKQRWDGRNYVCVNTGDAFRRESLILTRKGSWVIWRQSDWQGETDYYGLFTDKEAVEWLVRNGQEIPSRLRDLVAQGEV